MTRQSTLFIAALLASTMARPAIAGHGGSAHGAANVAIASQTTVVRDHRNGSPGGGVTITQGTTSGWNGNVHDHRGDNPDHYYPGHPYHNVWRPTNGASAIRDHR
jgi:hypothetical protein